MPEAQLCLYGLKVYGQILWTLIRIDVFRKLGCAWRFDQCCPHRFSILDTNGSLDTGTVIWAAVWFSIFCIMNIAGAAIAGISQLILVLMLVGIMVIFAVAGIIKGVDMSQMTPFFPNGVGGFSACIPIATFAYMGAACICTSGSECKNPRDLGRALVWSSLTFIIVYCLALFVVLGTIDWKAHLLTFPFSL